MLKPSAGILFAAATLLLLAGAVACSQPEPTPSPSGALGAATPAAPVPDTGTSAPANPAPAPISSGSSAIANAEATLSAQPSPTPPSPEQNPADSPATAANPTPATEPIDSTAPAPDEDTLLQLIDPLDEPEFYCVDVPGFRDSLRTDRPLQAHTCKPGAADELFRLNQPADGQLRMPAYDLCMEAAGDLVYTRTCADSPAQQFRHGADGAIRTGDGQLCLSVAPGDGEPAGGQSHLRRDLRLVPCAAAERHLSRWILPGPNPSSGLGPSGKLMHDALDSALIGDPWEIEKMGASGDPAYIPVLVELMRFPWWRIDRAVEEAIFDSIDRIAEQNPDITPANAGPPTDEWFRWIVWIGQRPEVWPPPGFAGWKGQLYAEMVDPDLGAFLYDGMRSNIRVEEIVWGGVPKDGIPDLTDAPVLAGAAADYLDPEDRVFGVSFNGEHRAYPHRIINAHEMANDVVGGVPFALAY